MEKLTNSGQWDNIKASCKIKSLKSHGETIVNNTGLWKDIIIIIISLCLGIIGFLGNIEKQWLRVIFKLCAIPAVLVIIAGALLIYAVAYASSPEGQAALAKAERKRKSAKEIKRQTTIRVPHTQRLLVKLVAIIKVLLMHKNKWIRVEPL